MLLVSAAGADGIVVVANGANMPFVCVVVAARGGGGRKRQRRQVVTVRHRGARVASRDALVELSVEGLLFALIHLADEQVERLDHFNFAIAAKPAFFTVTQITL